MSVILKRGSQVIQHGRKVGLKLKKTQNKGWGKHQKSKYSPDIIRNLCCPGLFTRETVAANRFIGVYAGELITTNESDVRGL